MGRPEVSWTFNYEDLARIAGKSVNAVQRSRTREGGYDPDNLESVLFWCARNARPELKAQLMEYGLSYYIQARSESSKAAHRTANKKRKKPAHK